MSNDAPTSAPGNGSGQAVAGFELVSGIREAIVSGTFDPRQKLKFEELRARFGGSMGSLREALLQLVSEGLVRTEANRSFTVAPASVADLNDITELRLQFERQTVTDAIQRVGDTWEAEIVASLHLLVKQASAADGGTRSQARPVRHRRFHHALVAACGSPWLLHFRGVLFDQAERYRSLGRLYRREPRDVVVGHRALADAVLARDVALACELSELHIRGTVRNVMANVPELKAAVS